MSNKSNNKILSDYDKISASYHEASHTLIGLSNFFDISKVSLTTENKEDHGNTFFDNLEILNNNQELTKLLITNEVQFLYAGMEGEKIYYQDICGSASFPRHLKKGSWEDIEKASRLIRKNDLAETGKTTSDFKKKLQERNKEFLLEHWDDIKLIAHSLYKKKTLYFDDLKYILTRNSSHKDFWKEKFKKIKLLHENDDLEIEIIKTLISPKI